MLRKLLKFFPNSSILWIHTKMQRQSPGQGTDVILRWWTSAPCYKQERSSQWIITHGLIHVSQSYTRSRLLTPPQTNQCRGCGRQIYTPPRVSMFQLLLKSEEYPPPIPFCLSTSSASNTNNTKLFWTTCFLIIHNSQSSRRRVYPRWYSAPDLQLIHSRV